MHTFEWQITGMHRDPDTGVVRSIHWRCACRDQGLETSTVGSVDLPPITPRTPGFIQFQQITRDQAMQWLMTHMEDERLRVSGLPPRGVEQRLLEMLQAQLEPPRFVTETPW